MSRSNVDRADAEAVYQDRDWNAGDNKVTLAIKTPR
jgi:hypothetical protein